MARGRARRQFQREAQRRRTATSAPPTAAQRTELAQHARRLGVSVPDADSQADAARLLVGLRDEDLRRRRTGER